MFYGHNPFNFNFHNILCGIVIICGLGLVVFGVNQGFIDDTIVGTLAVLIGFCLMWLGWDNRDNNNE